MSGIEENREELVEMLPKGPHSENIEETTEKDSEIVTSDVKTIHVKSAKPDVPDTSQCACESGIVDVEQKHSCDKDVQLSVKTEDVPKVKRKRGCWDYVKDMDIYKLMA